MKLQSLEGFKALTNDDLDSVKGGLENSFLQFEGAPCCSSVKKKGNICDHDKPIILQ